MIGEFVVIGLGMFGRNVALNLVRAGQSVLAVDRSEEEVNRVAAEIDAVVCADATDEAAVRDLQLERMTCAVVAIGAASMEASILTTALLRQTGVPRIIARSLSELHTRVLRAVGAHEVVSPEEEMGQRLARRLAQPNVLERIDLGESTELAEIPLPHQLAEKTILELNIRRRYGVTVVAIRREGSVLPAVATGERLRPGDVLVVIGSNDGIGRLAALA